MFVSPPPNRYQHQARTNGSIDGGNQSAQSHSSLVEQRQGTERILEVVEGPQRLCENVCGRIGARGLPRREARHCLSSVQLCTILYLQRSGFCGSSWRRYSGRSDSKSCSTSTTNVVTGRHRSFTIGSGQHSSAQSFSQYSSELNTAWIFTRR